MLEDARHPLQQAIMRMPRGDVRREVLAHAEDQSLAPQDGEGGEDDDQRMRPEQPDAIDAADRLPAGAKRPRNADDRPPRSQRLVPRQRHELDAVADRVLAAVRVWAQPPEDHNRPGEGRGDTREEERERALGENGVADAVVGVVRVREEAHRLGTLSGSGGIECVHLMRNLQLRGARLSQSRP